jgi:hypothetical protein
MILADVLLAVNRGVLCSSRCATYCDEDQRFMILADVLLAVNRGIL